MNRRVIVILVLALASVPVFSSGFGMVFNVNYNAGNSDFFNETETLFQSSGFNYLERKKNKMGMGFNAGLVLSVTSRLSVIPGFTINFGHQNYEFLRVEESSDSDTKDNYSFFIYSGEVKANYDIIMMKNGWRITLLLGVNYNSFKADDETGLDDSEFWGAEAGIGVKFFQLEHFGFQSFLIYKYPFTEKSFEYLSLQAGIIYRF